MSSEKEDNDSDEPEELTAEQVWFLFLCLLV